MRARRAEPRARRTRGRAPPRFVRAVLLLLRALAMCLALHLSGLVHFALDRWHGDDTAHHASDCPDDGGDEDCPPGCPSCHCVHVSPALPVPFATLGPSRLLPAYEMAWTPYEARTPPALAPPGVYRPPRA